MSGQQAASNSKIFGWSFRNYRLCRPSLMFVSGGFLLFCVAQSAAVHGQMQDAPKVEVPEVPAVNKSESTQSPRSRGTTLNTLKNVDPGQLFDNLKSELSDLKITNDKDGTIHIRGSKINIDLPASKHSIHVDSKDLKIDAEGELGPGAKGLTVPAQLKPAMPAVKEHLKAIEESMPAMIP